MKLRDILFLFGALCLAIGPVLMRHVASTSIYLTGEILTAAGPVLMGARAVMSDGSPANPPLPPPQPNPPTNPKP